MRILLVSMSESIHTAKWISHIADQGWDLHLFPSIDMGISHPEMTDVTIHHSVYGGTGKNGRGLKNRGLRVFSRGLAKSCRKLLKSYFPDYRVRQLKKVIEKVRPDIIHSIEIQHAGYLTGEVKKIVTDSFPPWLVTNWGSDIYLFGRLSEHKQRIRDVLSECDFYSCECHRDVDLAKEFGFKGKVLPVFPNTGGFDLELISGLRQSGKISDRRIIMLKGYQHWAGRALVGLRALERCSEILKGYEIAVYSAFPDVKISAELFHRSTGIPVRVIAKDTPHQDILKLHGRSRISIGLSISDAISTSCLEAMAMGSFPIQSWTSCSDEWIRDGENGILVPPEDPEIVEKAIRRAMTDDGLVNSAAEINYCLAEEKLGWDNLKPMTIDIYNIIASCKKG